MTKENKYPLLKEYNGLRRVLGPLNWQPYNFQHLDLRNIEGLILPKYKSGFSAYLRQVITPEDGARFEKILKRHQSDKNGSQIRALLEREDSTFIQMDIYFSDLEGRIKLVRTQSMASRVEGYVDPNEQLRYITSYGLCKRLAILDSQQTRIVWDLPIKRIGCIGD